MRARTMLSPLRFSFATAATAALLALSTPASAAPSASAAAGVRTVARTGEARPWLYAGRATVGAVAAHDLDARARAVVKALAPEAAHLELVVMGTDRFGDGDAIVRFDQTFKGLPVIGRGAAVRLDARGESVLSAIRLETSLPASVTPVVVASAAATAASQVTRLPVDGKDAHLAIVPTVDGARLAWVVVPDVPVGIPSAPWIVVDAIDGRVLQAKDRVVFAHKAKVYETNPITSPTLVTQDLEITPDGSGHLQNDFVQSQNCVDNKTVKDVQGQFKVHVCDLTQLAAADANGDFIYDPVDDPKNPQSLRDPFSEVSMYHHVARVYTFFRTLQGDPTAQVVVDKPLPTISNLQTPPGFAKGDFSSIGDPDKPLDPLQNAFFSPGGQGDIFGTLYGLKGGAMFFGQGPTHDYSYDGDVVYHEFTHAVVGKTLQLEQWHLDKYGVIDTPGAMNEGLADYFSSALAGDPNVGEYASKDISASLDVIRTLANDDTCPSAVIGEVHYDSTLFSGGLWSARASLPEADRSKFDAALYKAMRTNAGDGDLGYEDLANLFLETLKTDFPAGATALTTAMTTRGVLPGCTRIFDGSKPLAAPTTKFSTGEYAAPGTQSVAGAKVVPGILQVKLELPDGTTHVNVTIASKPAATGGGPLGGGGTFEPVFLAKYGSPILWTKATSDADQTVTPKQDTKANTYSATFDVPPAGSKVIYVQIANSGQGDGGYSKVTLTTDTNPPEGADAGPVTAPPAPDAGTPGGNNDNGGSSNGGCACNTAGQGGTQAGLLAGLVGAALLFGRRRRAKK